MLKETDLTPVDLSDSLVMDSSILPLIGLILGMRATNKIFEKLLTPAQLANRKKRALISRSRHSSRSRFSPSALHRRTTFINSKNLGRSQCFKRSGVFR